MHPLVVFLEVGDTLVDGRPELDHYCRVFREHDYHAPKEAILSNYLLLSSGTRGVLNHPLAEASSSEVPF